MLYLSGADVSRCLPMIEAVEAMEDAFLSMSSVNSPNRLVVSNGRSDLLVMPCVGEESTTVKVVSVRQQQGEADESARLPLIHSLVYLCSSATGQPLCILEGSRLTAIRTGAVTGLAAKWLSPVGAKSLAIIGAALTQALAVVCVRPDLEIIKVYSRSKDRAESFATDLSLHVKEMLGGQQIPVHVCESSDDAVSGSDIVVTATNSAVPVISDKCVKDGCFIAAVGNYKKHQREIPGETVARAFCVGDSLEACGHEAGEFHIPLAEGLVDASHFSADLSSVIAVKREEKSVGNSTSSTLTNSSGHKVVLFKSCGLAIEDLFAAKRAFSNARKHSLGIELPL